MFKRLRGYFSSDLSIDLGTANTLIYVRGRGIVLNEPSVVADAGRADPRRQGHRRGRRRSQEHAGSHAGAHHRRAPHEGRRDRRLHLHREDAAVLHQEGARQSTACSPSPRVLVACRSDPRRWRNARSRRVRKAPVRAASIRYSNRWRPRSARAFRCTKPRGSMVLDVGGGTSEVAVISLNGIVYASSVRIGGDRFDEAITNYVRRNYGILIGEATAERVKLEIGSAYPGQQVREMSVKGRNLSEGVPRSFTLNSNEILEALQEPLQGIVGAVKQALEQTPPELGADVADRGIVLTGGGALLRDIDKLLMEENGLAGRGRGRSAHLRSARRRPNSRAHRGTWAAGCSGWSEPRRGNSTNWSRFRNASHRPILGRGPSPGFASFSSRCSLRAHVARSAPSLPRAARAAASRWWPTRCRCW